MASRESNLERYFRIEVKKRGGWAIKFRGVAGIPDRLVILPGGRIVWVELKTEKGRVSKIQKAIHRKLLAMGCEVEVLKGRAEVDEWLELNL